MGKKQFNLVTTILIYSAPQYVPGPGSSKENKTKKYNLKKTTFSWGGRKKADSI